MRRSRLSAQTCDLPAPARRQNQRVLRARPAVDSLWVVLEAHLDAGFFSLPFGSSYSAQAAYTAVCIARGFSNPASMTEMLTTPVNATISHFTASDLFDSLVAIQAVCPELREYLHKYIAQATERFNSALSFSEYLDRNRVMWTEYHEFLYPRTPIINARDKGELVRRRTRRRRTRHCTGRAARVGRQPRD